MSDPSELRALASRFFDAIERGAIEEVQAIYAPRAIIWHNTDQLETSASENLGVLKAFVQRIRERRYERRRVETFQSGFVQQHVLTGRRKDGLRLELPACVICSVQDGRILRLDEYFDAVSVAPWMVEFPD